MPIWLRSRLSSLPAPTSSTLRWPPLTLRLRSIPRTKPPAARINNTTRPLPNTLAPRRSGDRPRFRTAYSNGKRLITPLPIQRESAHDPRRSMDRTGVRPTPELRLSTKSPSAYTARKQATISRRPACQAGTSPANTPTATAIKMPQASVAGDTTAAILWLSTVNAARCSPGVPPPPSSRPTPQACS